MDVIIQELKRIQTAGKANEELLTPLWRYFYFRLLSAKVTKEGLRPDTSRTTNVREGSMINRWEDCILEKTISGMIGKGSVTHNTRAFSAKNVDKERSGENVEFCNEDIKQVYHKLFDVALERYNAKQKRSDRRIDDYYEKIRRSKQEKLFHEVIFQIGNKDNMNAKSSEGQLAKEILTEFMQDFQKRNPNLYVFSSHIHMDEETPHIHIDFVPFIRNNKRGLDTRVTLKSALAEQGFKGGTRGATECNQWIEAEKKELAKVMEQNIHTYDENEEWQLPEPGALMSAKAYRDKKAFPLVTKLKEKVKQLTIKCVRYMEQIKKLTDKADKQTYQISYMTDKLMEQSDTIGRLQEKAADLGRVERYMGVEKVQTIVEQVKAQERRKGIQTPETKHRYEQIG